MGFRNYRIGLFQKFLFIFSSFSLVAGMTACQKAPTASGVMAFTDPPTALERDQYIPFVDIKKRRNDLKILSSEEIHAYCRHTIATPVFPVLDSSLRLSGSIARASSSSDSLLLNLNMMIETYVSGSDAALNLIKGMLRDAAKVDAFVRVIPNSFGLAGHNPYNEPLFHQSLLLIPIGTIYPELVRVYGEKDKEVQLIRKWVDKLYQSANSGRDNFTDRSQGVDRAAAKAAAFSIWGTASQNKEIVLSAYYYFLHAVSGIGKSGKHINWGYKGNGERYRYYNNMTYGFSVLAAEIFMRNGMSNAYDLPGNGKSLHKAIDWLVTEAIAENDEITVSGYGQGTRTLAWTEIYQARFPKEAVSILIDREIYRPIFGNMSGGPTTCIFKPISR